MTDEELKEVLKNKYFEDSDYIEIFEMIALEDSDNPFDCSGVDDFRNFTLDTFIGIMPDACKWFIKGLVKEDE